MGPRLAGKVALVTGGASGIGAALAAQLVAEGAEVWIADRQYEAASKLLARLAGAPGESHAIELDVRDYASFERVVAEIELHSGRIDYLFNNAGIGVAGEIDAYDLSDWDDVFDVNLRGVAHGIQAVYPIMMAQGSGHIVNTASMAGLVTSTGQGSYAATKHAVVALSKTLRLEAERHGVAVSVLCPGVIRTPILTGGKYGRFDKAGTSDEQLLQAWERMRPMEPDDFARRALQAVLRNRAVIVYPGWWKALWYLERLSPALTMRLLRSVLKRQRAAASVTSETSGIR